MDYSLELPVIDMKKEDQIRQQARRVKIRRIISPSLKRDLLQFYGFDVEARKARKLKEN